MALALETVDGERKLVKVCRVGFLAKCSHVALVEKFFTVYDY
jgi:hypothetical protein